MNSPVRVLVVDDSAFMRRVITTILEKDPLIQVIGFARNGQDALEKAITLKPDVLTLDVEMPVMDGLTTLGHLMKSQPTPVVMVSNLTTNGAEETIKALALGAVDFVTKPDKHSDLDMMARQLTVIVKLAAKIPVNKLNISSPRKLSIQAHTIHPGQERQVKVVAIGTSTGGPAALQQLLVPFPKNFPVGMVIVQHMPPGFTRPLAQRLNAICQLNVKEAEEGDIVQPGQVLIAPAGSQTLLKRLPRCGTVHIDHTSHLTTLFRPSVDVLLLSVAETYGQDSIGVLLTGMGNDGVLGLKAIRDKKGSTLVEAESTCIVFGMPKAAIEAGVADKVVPLHQMASAIIEEVH